MARAEPAPRARRTPLGGTFHSELSAAGIADPGLRASYRTCRQLNAAYGRTYFLATRLLPDWKRPYVHALYGFARYADEIVDDLASELSLDEKAQRLDAWAARFLAGSADDPVLPAVHDTIRRWHIPIEHFQAFITSMRMDLTVREYATWDDLMTYVYGSAAVIGLQMLPILEPRQDAAAVYARDLGKAFQLANFLRDVGEDLRRDRIYLPMDSLALFGLDRQALASGVVDGRVRRLLAFEIARCRELFRSAAPGIRLLHPSSQPCIQTALRLYAAILDEIEKADYQVLDRRVRVGTASRLRVAGPAYVRAVRQRRARGPAPRAAPTTPTR